MNIDQCANCLLQGWKEVEDSTTLQRCKRCKFIKYCGRDCQTEHWLNVHHKHCKYFADPIKAQQWDHKKEDCAICLRTAVVGRIHLMRADNPNYACIFEEVKKVPPGTVHPHPFPAAGDPTNIDEKSILVLWHLLHKFWITQPGVVRNCREELQEVFSDLMTNRLKIWLNLKISPKPQRQTFTIIPIDLSSVGEKIQEGRMIPDPFELWKIIKLVVKISVEVNLSQKLSLMINPLVDMPSDLHGAVSQAVSNAANFLATANDVLDALFTQVIPYRDVLSIICGGSVEKACTFCSKQIIITDVTKSGSVTGPFALFGFANTTMFCCASNSCLQKANSTREDYNRSATAMEAARAKRGRNRCDFCFKIPPSGDVHRCGKCLSVMYCGTDCRDQDWKIHQKVCKEDVEERKKKFGRSARRKEGKEALERLEKKAEDVHVQEVSEVLGKFKLKNSKKKSNK